KYPTCMEEVSSKGQQYRLCHWLDYEKISVYEVKLIKQGVLIEATFPTTPQEPILLNELGTFVDSFKPGNPQDVPISADTV
ncbi:MAG TPA: hypothetical protein VMR45_00090, partial [Patescibacteria group bacterium]|nr:hypothetical protein [Patescibacteria group bacterium]